MANSLTQATAPTLASILELHKDDVMYSLNCHQVGEIVSFDPSTQTAEVQIKMQRTVKGEIKDYPVLIDCPCIVLGGGEGRITFPISAGDSCLVIFNDKDIDNWYDGGQKMPPRSQRLHSFSDAFALVGIHNRLNQISDYLADGTELKYGNSTIKLQNNQVTITDGTASVVLANGQVTITSTAVTVTSPTVAFSGAVTIAGALTVQGKEIGPNHVHSGVSRGNSNTNGVL